MNQCSFSHRIQSLGERNYLSSHSIQFNIIDSGCLNPSNHGTKLDSWDFSPRNLRDIKTENTWGSFFWDTAENYLLPKPLVFSGSCQSLSVIFFLAFYLIFEIFWYTFNCFHILLIVASVFFVVVACIRTMIYTQWRKSLGYIAMFDLFTQL